MAFLGTEQVELVVPKVPLCTRSLLFLHHNPILSKKHMREERITVHLIIIITHTRTQDHITCQFDDVPFKIIIKSQSKRSAMKHV
jgi:hypothetical protein